MRDGVLVAACGCGGQCRCELGAEPVAVVILAGCGPRRDQHFVHGRVLADNRSGSLH